MDEVLQKQKKSPRREELITAANVAKASTGELQEKLTNEEPRNRREGSKSALPGEKKRNLEMTLELLSTRRRELPEQHRLPQRRSPPPWHWGVSVGDLTGVVQHDDLGGEFFESPAT
ncbi:ribosome biogenesis regulatory protein [Culex quinquefasciatus]|uniref:Ribosome biogenesis regulatory protein n=1 Tax=Culex quinquefasciatus TaxID=7176 RepID=B0WHB7_CULQU|nr:ribosome biogenesis regulatory protein [Culex quinquefasciatus]|eukprot:XP_001848101.1 ribosome biogenesis regulatory protein [Culex quinquefasciatus]